MSETALWELHFEIERAVPAPPDRIGYAELQRAVDVGQRGRVKRAVSTLVALDVRQWQGVRQGRAVAQGLRTLEESIADGLTPMPEREIQTYPLLSGQLDAYITHWHAERGDPVDDCGGPFSATDGVTTYVTSSLGAGGRGSQAHTRPDLTVVVDLAFEHLGPWNDVHAVEVKPYWSVSRAALFEAAAQAALRRCTFSWLLVWVPNASADHFRPDQQVLIRSAEDALGDLETEAKELGLGLLVARSHNDTDVLEKRADPRRQPMEPRAAEELFAALGRSG